MQLYIVHLKYFPLKHEMVNNAAGSWLYFFLINIKKHINNTDTLIFLY
jgi:hypothetical protein